jgi:hypothetical protein
MKKLIYIFSLVLIAGCSSSIEGEGAEEPISEVLNKTVRIEALTDNKENDAIYVTYFDYTENEHNWKQYFFDYDALGNPEPIIIDSIDNQIFKKYNFRYIEGEIYRNNSITDALHLKIYVDDELVFDQNEEGQGDNYVNIKFNYDILTKTNN